MKAKCILILFSLPLIGVLSFMTAANAQGHVRIATENIHDKILYHDKEVAVDFIRIVFINITKKEAVPYILSPNEVFASKTIPVATYGNVMASVTFKEGFKIISLCNLEDKENGFVVTNGEKVSLDGVVTG